MTGRADPALHKILMRREPQFPPEAADKMKGAEGIRSGVGGRAFLLRELKTPQRCADGGVQRRPPVPDRHPRLRKQSIQSGQQRARVLRAQQALFPQQAAIFRADAFERLPAQGRATSQFNAEGNTVKAVAVGRTVRLMPRHGIHAAARVNTFRPAPPQTDHAAPYQGQGTGRHMGVLRVTQGRAPGKDHLQPGFAGDMKRQFRLTHFSSCFMRCGAPCRRSCQAGAPRLSWAIGRLCPQRSL